MTPRTRLSLKPLLRRLIPATEWLAVLFVLLFTATCASYRHSEPIRGSVVEVQKLRSFQGDIFYRMTIEWVDEDGVSNHVTANFAFGSREQMLFGEEGRTVCVQTLYGKTIRLLPCTS